MSSLSLVEAKLPPGFRFHPRDDELVCDYLSKKANHQSEPLFLIEVDVNRCEPWDFPETACVGGKDWYFYCQRDRKYATGMRKNRATRTGYWKATGKDRAILHKGTLVGMRKTLVFYQGRAPRGTKTDWVMHEFRLDGPLAPRNISSLKEEDWVLCRVFNKSRQVSDSWSSYLGGSQLIDSYINFDQTEADLDQQVSCLSAPADMESNILLHQTHIPSSFSQLRFPS